MAYKGVLLANEEKEIEERIENEETLFSWDTTIWSYIHGNSNQYLRVLTTFSPLIIGMLLCLSWILISDEVMSEKEIFTTIGSIAIGMLFFCLLMRIYVVCDIKYSYSLRKSGILLTSKRNLAQRSISFIRSIGWFGIIVCVVSIVYLGPIAFAGAGIFALSTIKIIGYQSKEIELTIPILDKTILFILEDKNIIRIISNPYIGSYKIYFDEKDRALVINNIKKYFNNVEDYNVKNIDESYDHPADAAAVKARHEILEEMRNLGVNV